VTAIVVPATRSTRSGLLSRTESNSRLEAATPDLLSPTESNSRLDAVTPDLLSRTESNSRLEVETPDLLSLAESTSRLEAVTPELLSSTLLVETAHLSQPPSLVRAAWGAGAELTRTSDEPVFSPVEV
jgi:hypothetical protein